MQPVDFVKALGVAILVMVLDLCCDYGFVTAWVLINHHPLTVIDPKTIELSSLATRIFGPILFALFVGFVSRKRPDRRPYAFAFSAFGFYVLLDWSMAALAAKADPHGPSVANSMLQLAVLGTLAAKLLGALVGAWLARRTVAR